MKVAYDFNSHWNNYLIRNVNGEDVRLMMNSTGSPLKCRSGCGQNGFCVERLCYQFPFQKYQIAYGSIVKNSLEELIGCDDKCDGDGLYCRDNLFGTGICLTALPVCKFVSKYKVSKCSTSEDCFNNIQDSEIKNYYKKYHNGSHCTLVDKSVKICCQEDPKSLKCPDSVTPILFQPECRSNCNGICYHGRCCPDIVQVKGVTRYGKLPFFTNMPCEVKKYSEVLIPMSGCVNGIVVRFGRDDIKYYKTKSTCMLLPDGEFYNGCIESNSTCLFLGSNEFVCVRNPLEHKNEVDLTFSDDEWIWIQCITFASFAIFGFWTTFFIYGSKLLDSLEETKEQY